MLYYINNPRSPRWDQYSHQWCALTMDGQVGYADGQMGWAGYGPHPASWMAQ